MMTLQLDEALNLDHLDGRAARRSAQYSVTRAQGSHPQPKNKGGKLNSYEANSKGYAWPSLKGQHHLRTRKQHKQRTYCVQARAIKAHLIDASRRVAVFL